MEKVRVVVDLSCAGGATYDEGGALLLVRAGEKRHGVHDLDAGVIVDEDCIRVFLPVKRTQRVSYLYY